MYKPLPKCITLEPSEIHGLGLFATQDILPNTCLGITHYFTGFEIIRTPLGGFGNHSDNPNCERKQHNNKWFLKTIKEEELPGVKISKNLLNNLEKI